MKKKTITLIGSIVCLIISIIVLSIVVEYYYIPERDKIRSAVCTVYECKYESKTCRSCTAHYKNTCTSYRRYECGKWDVDFYLVLDGVTYKDDTKGDSCQIGSTLTCYYQHDDIDDTLTVNHDAILIGPISLVVIFTVLAFASLVLGGVMVWFVIDEIRMWFQPSVSLPPGPVQDI